VSLWSLDRSQDGVWWWVLDVRQVLPPSIPHTPPHTILDAYVCGGGQLVGWSGQLALFE